MREAIPPLLQYVFMAWYLVEHTENFAFNFTFTFNFPSVYDNKTSSANNILFKIGDHTLKLVTSCFCNSQKAYKC